MAGEFNLYSQYAQTQAPISQFVPEKLPWELIYQVGRGLQDKQDANKATILDDSDLQVPAVFEHEKAYVKKRQEDLKNLVESTHGKDLTSGTEFYNFVNQLKEIKNDPYLATIKGNYDRVMDHYKQQSELEKDAALTDWNLAVPRETMEKYGAEGTIRDIGALDITKGLDLRKKKETYFDNTEADVREVLGKLNNADVYYSTTTTKKDADMISAWADRALNDYKSSAEGKEELRKYRFYARNPENFVNPKTGKQLTEDQYLKQELINTGMERFQHKTTSTLENALNIKAGWDREDKKVEDGVIRQPGNLTQGIDFQGLDDLDEQIAKETDPAKKTSLQNAKAKAMAEFVETEKGKQATAKLAEAKTVIQNQILGTMRQGLDVGYFGGKGYNLNTLALNISKLVNDVNSSTDLNSLHGKLLNIIKTNKNFDKLSESEKSSLIWQTTRNLDDAILSKDNAVGNNIFGAMNDYNSAFEESMAGKTFSVGDVLTHANPTIQEKTDKQFKQAYEVSDFSVIGEDSGSDKEKAILDAIHQSTYVTVKPVDNSETNTPELEVTYDDPETDKTITHRILAKDNRSVGLYHTLLKNYGDTGKNVSERLQHASFVPPMGKAISLQDHGYSDVPKAYTAMTNKDGSTMTLYKDSKPITFAKYISTLPKNVANAAIKNEIWKMYGVGKLGIFTSINDPKIEKIINAKSVESLNPHKEKNGISEQDIYHNVMNQYYKFNAAVDLYNTAKILQ